MESNKFLSDNDTDIAINNALQNGRKDDSQINAEEDIPALPNNAAVDLLYRVNEIPPTGILLSVALQNILIGLGGCLTTSYFISDVICAPQDHPIRSQLFCTTLFMSGLCTTFMPLLGIRLPVFQSVCSTFLVPLIGMRSDDRWNCKLLKEKALIELNQTSNTSLIQRIPFDANDEKEMFVRVREMMGCLLLASLLEVAVGATGLVGKALRFIGPLSVSVVVSLIGLSLYKIPLEYAQSHWPLTIMSISLVVVFMLYFDRVHIPIPSLDCKPTGAKNRTRTVSRLPLFQMFPIMLSIIITWGVCAILTRVGYFSEDPMEMSYRARTDIRTNIIFSTPWFYFPYPGRFGKPLFNTTIFIGFLATVVSSIFESIGDYHAVAQLSLVPTPPKSAVNRGILIEGIGSVISGALGAGHATTSSTANLALIRITKVASRSCLVATGVISMGLSVIGKLGAVLSTMPDPALGGAMFVSFGIMVAIGCFSLRSVDMRSYRNMAVFGISLYVGLVIPDWLDRNPKGFDIGSETANQIVKGILGSPMFLGGFVSIILDNTVKGSEEERGMHSRRKTYVDFHNAKVTVTQSEVYDLPGVDKLAEKFSWIYRLPFIQNQR